MSRRRQPIEAAEVRRWVEAMELGISVQDFARRFGLTTKSAREHAAKAGVKLPNMRRGPLRRST